MALVAQRDSVLKTMFYVWDDKDPEENTIAKVYKLDKGLNAGWRWERFDTNEKMVGIVYRADAFRTLEKSFDRVITILEN